MASTTAEQFDRWFRWSLRRYNVFDAEGMSRAHRVMLGLIVRMQNPAEREYYADELVYRLLSVRSGKPSLWHRSVGQQIREGGTDEF